MLTRLSKVIVVFYEIVGHTNWPQSKFGQKEQVRLCLYLRLFTRSMEVTSLDDFRRGTHNFIKPTTPFYLHYSDINDV